MNLREAAHDLTLNQPYRPGTPAPAGFTLAYLRYRRERMHAENNIPQGKNYTRFGDYCADHADTLIALLEQIAETEEQP